MNCNGTGFVVKEETLSVPIRRGVKEGDYTIIKGKGEPSVDGENGDLYVFFHIRKSDTYSISGNDLKPRLYLDLRDLLRYAALFFLPTPSLFHLIPLFRFICSIVTSSFAVSSFIFFTYIVGAIIASVFEVRFRYNLRRCI